MTKKFFYTFASIGIISVIATAIAVPTYLIIQENIKNAEIEKRRIVEMRKNSTWNNLFRDRKLHTLSVEQIQSIVDADRGNWNSYLIPFNSSNVEILDAFEVQNIRVFNDKDNNIKLELEIKYSEIVSLAGNLASDVYTFYLKNEVVPRWNYDLETVRQEVQDIVNNYPIAIENKAQLEQIINDVYPNKFKDLINENSISEVEENSLEWQVSQDVPFTISPTFRVGEKYILIYSELAPIDNIQPTVPIAPTWNESEVKLYLQEKIDPEKKYSNLSAVENIIQSEIQNLIMKTNRPETINDLFFVINLEPNAKTYEIIFSCQMEKGFTKTTELYSLKNIVINI